MKKKVYVLKFVRRIGKKNSGNELRREEIMLWHVLSIQNHSRISCGRIGRH